MAARIERFASALAALVGGHVDGLLVRIGALCNDRLCVRTQCLSFVEEQVLLRRCARLALGGEELTLEPVELLLEKVSFGTQ